MSIFSFLKKVVFMLLFIYALYATLSAITNLTMFDVMESFAVSEDAVYETNEFKERNLKLKKSKHLLNKLTKTLIYQAMK